MKKMKKVFSVIFIVVMMTGLVPDGLVDTKNSVEAATTIGNPKIVTDSYMDAEQMVTWDCVWFGSYPQTEIVCRSGCSGDGVSANGGSIFRESERIQKTEKGSEETGRTMQAGF